MIGTRTNIPGLNCKTDNCITEEKRFLLEGRTSLIYKLSAYHKALYYVNSYVITIMNHNGNNIAVYIVQCYVYVHVHGL